MRLAYNDSQENGSLFKEFPYYVLANPWIASFKWQGNDCWIRFCLMIRHQNNIMTLQWHKKSETILHTHISK